MALTPNSTFRRSALAATVIGLAALGFSARASAEDITANTNCTRYGLAEATAKDSVAADGYAALCEIQKGKVLRSEGRALRAEEQAEDKLTACLLRLKDYKEKSPADFATLGKITRDNACAAAGRIPKPTAGTRPTAG